MKRRSSFSFKFLLFNCRNYSSNFSLMNVKKMTSASYVEFAYRVNEIAENNNVAEPSAVKYIIAANIVK